MIAEGPGFAIARLGRALSLIAVARIAMPKSVVRLSAGREDMSEETQALCFLAGANSLDAMLLYERGAVATAALYVAASVALSIGGLLAGLALVRHFS
jgi:hypothetical protein